MGSLKAKFIEGFIRDHDIFGVSQRIRNLEITPQPNAILFRFQTTQPTVPIIEIFHFAHDQQGNLLFLPDRIVTVRFNFISAALGNFFTEHEGRIDGLEQDNEFCYRITAGDGAKPQAVAVGSFKTGRRSAAFVVRDIRVFNDGDPGLDGSGEMAFGFGFYNENDDLIGSHDYHDDIDSGEVRDLPFGKGPAFQSNFAPDWMAIYVRGQEDDHFFTPFHPWFFAPDKLPSATRHFETDVIVGADAFQYLALPNEWGSHRLGFSLDSGPWGIHFVVTGWVNVEATAPFVLPVITKSAQRLRMVWTPDRWATLSAVGQRTVVEHPNGRHTMFGLGPNGVLARRLKNEKFQQALNWKMIEASGVEAASLVATDDGVEIVVVSAGVVKHRFEPVSGQETATEWRELGRGFQPQLLAIPQPDGGIAVFALGLDGTVRSIMLERNSKRDQWTDLGHSFVGRIVALPKKNGVAIFGLTSEGDIQTATWQSGSQDALRWRSLEGEPSVFIYAAEEDDNTYVISVTRDRRVCVSSSENGHWSAQWDSLGTLDNVDWISQEASNATS